VDELVKYNFLSAQVAVAKIGARVTLIISFY